MSDFDKEAEREKLREKYEAEREDRESTQQMSELLLQGATMTNQHCDACGNPKFRYEGTTFCPACEGADGGASAAADTREAPESGGAQGAQANERTEAGADATPEANRPAETPGAAAQGATPASEAESGRPTAAEARAEASDRQTPARSAPSAGESDFSAARESVRATLTDLAARAERSTDAAHTRELLAAAKEAAETLRELNRLE